MVAITVLSHTPADVLPVSPEATRTATQMFLRAKDRHNNTDASYDSITRQTHKLPASPEATGAAPHMFRGHKTGTPTQTLAITVLPNTPAHMLPASPEAMGVAPHVSEGKGQPHMFLRAKDRHTNTDGSYYSTTRHSHLHTHTHTHILPASLKAMGAAPHVSEGKRHTHQHNW